MWWRVAVSEDFEAAEVVALRTLAPGSGLSDFRYGRFFQKAVQMHEILHV